MLLVEVSEELLRQANQVGTVTHESRHRRLKDFNPGHCVVAEFFVIGVLSDASQTSGHLMTACSCLVIGDEQPEFAANADGRLPSRSRIRADVSHNDD